MGLFDKFKKQKNEEIVEEVKVEEPKIEGVEAAKEIKEDAEQAKQAPKAETKEEKKLVSEVAKEGKRFTLLVENQFQLENNQGVVVGGNLYGELELGDVVYVIQPLGSILMAKVDGIEVGPGQTAERAANQKVTIFLADIKDKNQVPTYTVLTSIKPQTTVDVNAAVENPHLLGLSMDYPRLCKESTYLSVFVYVLCHANFVVPTSVDMVPENGDGTATIKKQTMLRFPSLQNPTDKKNIFPVFTDWNALSRWKNLFDDKHPARTMIMRFPEVISVSKGNGIVLNPFGPTPVMLPEDAIKQIVNMDGYKQEFVEKKEEAIQKVEVKQDAKALVGVPKDTDEIKMIRDALAAQGKLVKTIKRVDFLMKVDEQNEKAYLCIVDCPEEEATQIFNSLYKAAAPYFNEVKRMEFLLHGKTKLANDVVNEKSCIYNA